MLTATAVGCQCTNGPAVACDCGQSVAGSTRPRRPPGPTSRRSWQQLRIGGGVSQDAAWRRAVEHRAVAVPGAARGEQQDCTHPLHGHRSCTRAARLERAPRRSPSVAPAAEARPKSVPASTSSRGRRRPATDRGAVIPCMIPCPSCTCTHSGQSQHTYMTPWGRRGFFKLQAV